MLAACRSSAGDLAEIVGSHDPELFRAFFEQNTRHFGPYCSEGQKITDTLIDQHGEPMTTITLGPEGTFSHEVALKLNVRPSVFAPTIHAIMAAVARGEGDGIVPMENSEAGGVGETLDGLSKYPLLHHGRDVPADPPQPCLCGALKRIRVIFAHPQTHEQCSDKIEEWGIPVIHTSSNAASAQEARRTPNAAAILSEAAAALYKLPVIAPSIENNAANITRFVRISERPLAGPAGQEMQHPHRPARGPSRAAV